MSALGEGGDDAKLSSTVVRGAGLTGAGYLLTQVITFASYVAFAHLAEPRVFGTLAAGWTIVGVSSFVAESGMSSALIQRQDRLEEAASTAAVATLAAGMGLSLLALALSPLVGLYFHSGHVGRVAAALSGVLLLNAATVVPDALLRRRFSFLRRGVVDPLNALVYGAVGGALLAVGMGIWALVVATYVSGVARVISVWLFTRWLPQRRAVSFAIWRELARFGRHIVASEFLRQVSGVLNATLIGRFLGLAPLGEFRFGWRMGTQAALPVTSAGAYVLFPAFARIAGDTERFRAAFIRSLRLFAVFVIPGGFVLGALGEQIAVALLGERWRMAGVVLEALAGVTLALPMTTLAGEVFKAANRPDIVARVSLLLTCGTVASLVALLPLGVAGIAVGMSCAYLVAAAYSLHRVSRLLAISWRSIVGELWGPVVAACAMAAGLIVFAAVLPVNDGSNMARLAWLAVEVVLALALYGSALWIVTPATAKQFVQTLRTSLGRRKDRRFS